MTVRQARAGGREKWDRLVGVVSLIGFLAALNTQVAAGPALTHAGTIETAARQHAQAHTMERCRDPGVPRLAAIGHACVARVRPFAASFGEAGSSTEVEEAATLYPGQKFPVGDVPLSVAVADLNGDGFLDLVTANFTSGDVSVLLGRGDGAFAGVRLPVGDAPVSVAVGDLNGDGHPDLVTTSFTSRDVSVLLQQ